MFFFSYIYFSSCFFISLIHGFNSLNVPMNLFLHVYNTLWVGTVYINKNIVTLNLLAGRNYLHKFKTHLVFHAVNQSVAWCINLYNMYTLNMFCYLQHADQDSDVPSNFAHRRPQIKKYFLIETSAIHFKQIFE